LLQDAPPVVDPFDADLLKTAAVAAMLPGRPSSATIWRWMVKGTGGVKLPHVRIGRRCYTSRRAVRWFIEMRTRIDAERHAVITETERRWRNVDAELNALGL